MIPSNNKQISIPSSPVADKPELIGEKALPQKDISSVRHDSSLVDSTSRATFCPDWFTKLPVKADYLYAVATALSKSLQLAIDKAKLSCRSDIASQIKVDLESVQTQIQKEISSDNMTKTDEEFRQNTKSFISATLKDCKTIKIETIREGENWRACVLMEYPKKVAYSEFMKNLKNR